MCEVSDVIPSEALYLYNPYTNRYDLRQNMPSMQARMGTTWRQDPGDMPEMQIPLLEPRTEGEEVMPWPKGKPRSDETKAKIGAGNLGKRVTDETRKKQSAALKCRKLSAEHIEKMRNRPPISEETREKMSVAKKGKPLSLEHRLKLGDSHRGKKQSKERVEKQTGVLNHFFGKHHSPETKAKLSAARTGDKNPNYGKSPSLNTIEKRSETLKEFYRLHPESRDQLSKGKRGDKNPAWKDGLTPLSVSIRTGTRYKSWTQSVFSRDNFICCHCCQKGGKLEAHHIKTLSRIIRENHISTIEEADLCPELWDITNGTTMCISCHKQEHKQRKANRNGYKIK